MTPERSQAYGRVMKTLACTVPSRLHPRERDTIRAAADTLLFAPDLQSDAEARAALREMRALADLLVESDRWHFDSADGLLADVEDCGPALLPSFESLRPLAAA